MQPRPGRIPRSRQRIDAGGRAPGPSGDHMRRSMPKNPRVVTRRRFLIEAGLVGGAVAGTLRGTSLLALAGCAGASRGPGGPAATPNRWIRVPVSGLVVGEPQRVEFDLGVGGAATTMGRGATWLVLQPDGSVVAFAPSCTHQRCLYDWRATSRNFECRCHPGAFTVDGAVAAGPPPRPLDRYEARPAGPAAVEIGWIDGA